MRISSAVEGVQRLPLALVAAATLLLVATGLAPRPVAAQDVPTLAGQVTDEAGVVGGGRADLERALAGLLDRDNVQLYVAFVRTTGSDTAGRSPRRHSRRTVSAATICSFSSPSTTGATAGGMTAPSRRSRRARSTSS